MAKAAREVRRRSASLIGDRIAARRQELGLTQAEVAERLSKFGVEVGHATVSAWEWGRPRIAVDQLKALAIGLECSVTFLIGWTSDPKRWEPDEEPLRMYFKGDPQHLTALPGGSRRVGRVPYTPPLAKAVPGDSHASPHQRPPGRVVTKR